MKLFISYSRDDKAWTYELWRNIRDELHHDAWIDRRIVPAADWWTTILENIESCDVFVYVMTPKAVESIYCRAELNYAVALNKPILPLMLKRCDYPENLSRKRVQFQTITDDMNMDRTLLRITQGMLHIQQREYPPKSAPRPDVPKPKQNPEQVFETFALAEEAAAENNLTLAFQLFERVISADPDGLGMAAKERMDEITTERDRAAAYANVKRLAENPSTRRGAMAAWRAFQRQYENYDPVNLASTLTPQQQPNQRTSSTIPAQPRREESVGAKHVSPAVPKRPAASASAIRSIIGDPFDWCEVPAGEFIYGDDDNKYAAPRQKLTLPTFHMAKYPITYRQFQVFVDDREGFRDARWWDGLAAHPDQRKQPGDQYWKIEDHPCEDVCWYEAMAFTRWLSWKLGGGYAVDDLASWLVRLPTEFEWEKAARGTDGRIYPWGNDFDRAKTNTIESGIEETTPVTDYPQGASPYGVFGMSGNVFDWCLTDHSNPQQKVALENVSSNSSRVMRGGSWVRDRQDARAASRHDSYPSFRGNLLGIRVVFCPIQ